MRLNKVIQEFNVGLQTVVDFLGKQGFEIDSNPNGNISDEQYSMLRKEFGKDKDLRNEAEKMLQNRQKEKVSKKSAPAVEVIETHIPEEMRPQVVVKGSIDLNPHHEEPAEKVAEKPAPEQKAQKAPEAPAAEVKVEKHEEKHEKHEKKQKPKLSVEERAKAIGEENDGVFKLHTTTEITAPKVLGTIDLSSLNQNTRPKKKSKEERRKEREEKNKQNPNAQGANGEKKKRNRIGKERVDVNAAANQQGGNNNNRNRQGGNNNQGNGNAQGGNNRRNNNKDRNRKGGQAPVIKPDISDEDVAKQVKETLARLTNKQKGS